MFDRSFWLVLALSLALPHAGVAQLSDSVPPRTWIVGPTEGPGFCLILAPKGDARFVGGFTNLNPLRWRYDSAKGELSLSIPRMDTTSVRRFVAKLGTELLAFDSITHTVVYNTALGETLWFDGYTLFRKSALDTLEYARVPGQCKRS